MTIIVHSLLLQKVLIGYPADLKISNIKDIYGNSAEDVSKKITTAGTVAKAVSKDDVAGALETATGIEDAAYLNLCGDTYDLSETGISGTNDFSASIWSLRQHLPM